VFAYLVARDWPQFLEIQEELLLGIMEVVERAETAIALPSQTLHVAEGRLAAVLQPAAAHDDRL
jgi:MscS family membrane protein